MTTFTKIISWMQIILPLIYLICSIPIFNKVYQTSRMVIDEEFHLKQGRNYCSGRFYIWDPKITTFPGLYLVTCLLLPFKLCTTYYLRGISLIASVINVYLLMKITKLKKQEPEEIILNTISIGILPPLYFFAHLYYTDVLSVTSFLGFYYYSLKNYHKIASLIGLGSILMRQTNVVWIGMILGDKVLEDLVKITIPFLKNGKLKRNENYNFQNLFNVLKYNFINPRFFFENIIRSIEIYLSYISVIIIFICFLLYNGSIVIGDKSAHEATIHVPQIFYFILFTLFFGISSTLTYGISSLKIMKKHFSLTLGLCFIFFIIIKYNTLIHPYLLADNRHYTFYLWNRFYGKYFWAKFVPIPIYIFGLMLIWNCLKHKNAGFQLIFYVCTFILLVLQRLIEIRYFIIPFMIFRLNLQPIKCRYLILDILIYILINIVTFYIFFTKEIRWSNYDDIQRLIW